MQLLILAKFENILCTGFRATLNFKTLRWLWTLWTDFLKTLPKVACYHAGLKDNDQLVAYAARFLAVRLKNHVWSHHHALNQPFSYDIGKRNSNFQFRFSFTHAIG